MKQKKKKTSTQEFCDAFDPKLNHGRLHKVESRQQPHYSAHASVITRTRPHRNTAQRHGGESVCLNQVMWQAIICTLKPHEMFQADNLWFFYVSSISIYLPRMNTSTIKIQSSCITLCTLQIWWQKLFLSNNKRRGKMERGKEGIMIRKIKINTI